jgi:thiosulfate dehydrogenase [quinone] large subunit
VLLGPRAPSVTPVEIDTLQRRTLVLGSGAAVALGASVLLLGGADAAAGRIANKAPSPKGGDVLSLTPPSTTSTTSTTTTTVKASTNTTTPTSATTTTTAPKGTLLGTASEVKKNSSARFTIPSSGDPGILIHTAAGDFVGYDAVCPHMGCTVGYSSSAKVIVCPCHGSEFQVSNGDVIIGPAPHGLAKLAIVEESDGNLYLE